MPTTLPDFYKHHQDHINRNIARLLKCGTNRNEHDATHKRQEAELRADSARLSRLLNRLSTPQREAVLSVLAQESGILIFQFILECAHLLNEPAREIASRNHDEGAFHDALESFQALVRG